MFLALVFGPWLIRKLRELQIGQYIREEGPQEHKKKAGTPTMGGVLIVLSTAVPVLLWADLSNPFILLALFALIAFAAIGFIDDYAKVAKRRNHGTDGEEKTDLAVQCQPCRRRHAAGPVHAQRVFDAVDYPFLKRFRPDLGFTVCSIRELSGRWRFYRFWRSSRW